MAKFMQIIDVEANGDEVILHPETTADYVEAGSTYKVSKITEVNDWNEKSQEIVAARKGQSNLKSKIDQIDTALEPSNLLSKIKSVDGSGSGLDADLVDGKTVNDSDSSVSSLWTANKILNELNKKVNNSDVVTTASPNKILKLSSDGSLKANVNGNASTATTFRNPEIVNFIGDVTGSVNIDGGKTKSVNLSVVDNSHNHSGLVSSATNEIKTTGKGNIVDFKVNGSIVSSINNQGKFTGDAASIQGYTVSNENPSQLWTGSQIKKSIRETIDSYGQKGSNFVKVGPLTYAYGEATVERVTTTTIRPSALGEGEKIISENYTITSSDNTLTCVKNPSSNTREIKIDFNKSTAPGTKIGWCIVSI